ncbi:MAG: S9 family peptidase [Cytophagaceae bacterium]|nr:S9 family peptidase [Cytophagaceae bacterium]
MKFKVLIVVCLSVLFTNGIQGQGEARSDKLLSIERLYSGEFKQQYERAIRWIENGDAYVIIEPSTTIDDADELVYYNAKTQARRVWVAAKDLQTPNGQLPIESFTVSPDGSRVILFTNSSRVWRSNTKGDYYVYDLDTKKLNQLGASLRPSSLMFAKFATDNAYVYYVHDFNIYKEHAITQEQTQLTFDGSRDIINGTFDWVYEEEFGLRDGFSVNPKGSKLAFWQLNATGTGVFYMINNTDSIYSKPIPLQYPKVGESPSGVRVGVIDLTTNHTHWVPLEGDPKAHYIPGMQWVNDDLLLIQQMNRLQNTLWIWSYVPSTKTLKKIYTEKEDTWVDIGYPDVSANGWGDNDLMLVDDRSAFLRMRETDTWRHVYKIDIRTGEQTLLTPFDYDIASLRSTTDKELYYIASPDNSTQRYLYKTDLKGKGKSKRVTPQEYQGLNTYNMAPNGKYALHIHQSHKAARSVRFINLPQHKTLKTIAANTKYTTQLSQLEQPEVIFTQVTTKDDLDIDVRMIRPPHFDPSKTYPVLFHVYGEPWGQVALDNQIGLWNTMMAQKGYVIIDMDNRGTPCLKGSAWRKSIYRKIGVLNTSDQAKAATEILKLPYLDANRTAVWGWSGGGSMTLNLMFQYPDIYKTGVAVAAVSDQLIYDNIYQERYMGLPQNNKADFIAGSPKTYAKNLEGNLLIIHGTADDNVHYQSAEIIINELIKADKQFDMMAYPNRSHGIYEGRNTRKHLYTLITNYILEHTPIHYPIGN